MKILHFFAALFVLVLMLAAVAPAEEVPSGTIVGKWQPVKNQPMAGGFALVFSELTGPPPDQERYWRVPDFIAGMDDEGRFYVQVPPGKYYLGTMKRQQGSEIGPLLPGDLSFFSESKGKPVIYAVKAGQKLDVGVLTGAVKHSDVPHKSATAIEGTVVDGEGKPLAGVLVFAYLNKELQGRPLFVAPKTGPDGKFRLGLSEGGDYYLKIRDIYGGGRPQKGQIMGIYGGENPIPVVIKSGVVSKGITITGARFAGRGPEGEAMDAPPQQ